MQTTLLEMPAQLERAWFRAALRECIAYGEHGLDVEIDEHGHEHCFNCGGAL